MQPPHQRPILGLRVADDDVVAGQEVNAQNLSFCREALARAGRAEDDTVRVLEQLAVDGNHVAAECIHAAVERARTALEQLLRRERHKNSEARRGQASLYLYAVESERQAAHKRVLLLEVQRHKLAVVLLRNALGLQYRVFELLQAVCGVQDGEREQEHTLVATLQLLKQLLRLAAVGGEVARQYVHVVTGPDRLLLLLYFRGVQLGQFPLDRFYGAHLVEGLDVHTDDERAVHLKEVSEQPVIQLRRDDVEEGHGAVFRAHAEVAARRESKTARRDEVLDAQAGGSEQLPVELELLLSVDVEYAVHQGKAGFAVQRLGLDAELAEVVEDVQLKALKPGLCGLVVLGLDAEG